MSREVVPGVLVVDSFPAFEFDGYTKRSGLTAADFEVTVFRDGAVDTTVVTITEIGTTGEYKTECTFAGEGYYSIQIFIKFSKDMLISTYDVGSGSASIYAQVKKIDLAPTLGPHAVVSGSLMDRMMNKDSQKSYNQGTDSLEAIRDRQG